MTIGQRITALRKGRGMTQEILAEQVGVTRQSVSKWELDQAIPEVGCAVALCDLFEVSLDYLLRGTEMPSAGTAAPSDVHVSNVRSDAPPPSPKPLTRRGYGLLYGAVGLLGTVLCLYVLPFAHRIHAEAVLFGSLLIYGALLPLPSVYLATRHWSYTDGQQGFGHLWKQAAWTLTVGHLLLLGGWMLYLKWGAEAYTFWSTQWGTVWYQFLIASVVTLAVLLPLLVRFHGKQWLCWILYALSPALWMAGLQVASAATGLFPSAGRYWALTDTATALAILALLLLSQTAVWVGLERQKGGRAPALAVSPFSLGTLSVGAMLGVLVFLSVGGGICYAVLLAGLPTEYSILGWSTLPGAVLLLLRGSRYPHFRAALTDTGRLTALYLPLLLAAHGGLVYLSQYLLTFGGPMPALHMGRYLLVSAVSALVGSGIAIPLLCGARKWRWVCILLVLTLLAGTAAAVAVLPSHLY